MKQLILTLLVVCTFCFTLLPAIASDQEEKKINVYPNPVVRGTPMTIEMLMVDHGEKTVIIYNTVGKEIHKLKTTDKKIELNAPDVSGIYVLRIIEKNKVVAAQKIIVME